MGRWRWAEVKAQTGAQTNSSGGWRCSVAAANEAATADGARAAVRQAGRDEQLCRMGVRLRPLGLPPGRAVKVQAGPCEVAAECFLGAGDVPGGVGVVDAQEGASPRPFGKEDVVQRGAQSAEVQSMASCWRRCEAHNLWWQVH